MEPIVLASASPRRAELLRQIGLCFQVIPSGVSEEFNADLTPPEQVMALAFRKANDVAFAMSEGLIIGADTLVVLDGQVLGKPSGPEEAQKMLSRLSGREHSVFTGISLVNVSKGQTLTDYVETKVRFRRLKQEEINFYIASKEPLDKAGAYGIQGLGAIFVDKIDGCYSNVVGLPLSKLAILLQKMGIFVMG